ncbi:MAG: type II toxin-antitoxin system VapC family toxin [Planctomycetes bacterium]|nr:type II toxin-antitoxin system VapC family toxin [Planctomycetota bacterium]
MATRLLLDTNRCVDVCRGDATAVANVARAEAVFVPFVVLGPEQSDSADARSRLDRLLL